MVPKRQKLVDIPEVRNWIDSILQNKKSKQIEFTNFNQKTKHEENLKAIYSLELLNNIDDLLSFIEILNSKTEKESLFIGVAETHSVRKSRLLQKFIFPFNWVYYTGDFMLTRVSPKLSFTKNIYYYFSRGKGNVLSKTEILGRFYFSGYTLIEEKNINNKWFFVVKKEKELDEITNQKPQMGLLIKLPRIGKNGKNINVYKFRTMHPYAQFLQEYIHQKNDLKEGGKFENDFRINTVGKFMRKYWIDELPMILNVLKGEMKLIGVRPLSEHYLSLYDTDLQQLRSKSKPGLLPPFYVDFPKTLEEIQASEKRYLLANQKNPWQTDLQYFFNILINILIKGKRSA